MLKLYGLLLLTYYFAYTYKYPFLNVNIMYEDMRFKPMMLHMHKLKRYGLMCNVKKCFIGDPTSLDLRTLSV